MEQDLRKQAQEAYLKAIQDGYIKPVQWGSYTPSRNGRSFILGTCPFCSARIKAFIWSLAGGGKKCECGALLTRRDARKFPKT